jgi:amino acid adenylation domain-containing protein
MALESANLLLHRLIEAHVATRPEGRAVVLGESVLSYAELNERANRLAHHLARHGVGPDVIVGVYLEPSLDLVVALLAVLKAGGAYLPLDPRYPAERLAFMLSDCRVPVLVGGGEHGAVAFDGARIDLVADAEAITNEPSTNLACDADAENLAYIIYTSGSTGRPKGVLIPHGRVARLLSSTEAWFRFDASDVWTFFHSFAFDFSVWEIWGALCYGGTVVVVPEDIRRSPEQLLELLVRQRVTVLNQVPSAFRNLIAAATRTSEPRSLALRLVIFGGEPLELGSLARWLARYPDTRLVNMYGITETTVHVTYRPIDPDECGTTRGSPIGVPIPDLEMYLLDAALTPVGEGEIYVGGAGLARGYHQRAALTAERFVPDPFSGRPGARLYKTGDLARRLPDGSFDYLGRNDAQVKIRGYRIETGEIAETLRAHPAVREAAVVAQAVKDGDRRLVAYLVRNSAVQPAVEELRSFVGHRLPGYMVPAAFLWLDTMPLTPTGKIDHRALPAVGSDRASDVGYRAPETTEERLVAATWSELLAIDRVGAYDDFFHLGGHSLNATQLISRVRELFGVELSLRNVFEHSTLAAFARLVREARDVGHASTSPITPRDDSTPPLSFAQQRLWLAERLHPDTAVYNLPLAFRLAGAVNVPALEQALQTIHARHDTLRSTFSADDDRVSITLSNEPFVLDQIDLRRSPNPAREARDVVDSELARPFDLAAELPWRTILVRTGGAEHVLVVTMHHIASDGWSSDVFTRELGAAYRAALGLGPGLAALPIRYGDYAAWQRETWTDNVLAPQLAYWQQRLAGSPPLIELPHDRPRPAVRSFNGGRHEVVVSGQLSRALAELSRAHGTTLYMTMLAAFQTLLHRFSSQTDIVIGSPVAGRSRRELEGLIGCFVNTLAIRTDFARDPTFVELLAQVRETVLEANAHQEVPFDKVVESLHPERSASYQPVVQTWFRLDRPFGAELTLPGVTITNEVADSSLAMFDLTMDIIQRPDDLWVKLEFARDLFDDETIAHMAEQFVCLLEDVIARPATRVSRLALLGPSERAARVACDVQWEPPRRSAVEQLERAMRATPDAPALVSRDQAVAYGALDASSARLAAWLRQLGLAPDGRAVVLANRGVPQIVGLLAVLRAGGAYVPIQLDLPDQRLAWIVGDTAPTAILCDGPLPAALTSFAGVVVRLDRPDTWLATTSLAASAALPDALAYVIYTSGSTGTPKGVMVTRRGLDAQLDWIRSEFRFAASTRCLQLTSAMFDISAVEILAPLLAGGAVILPRVGLELDVAHLADLAREHRATVVNFVPTLLRLVLETCSNRPWLTIETVLVGGEALPPDLLQAFAAVFPRAALHNQYGPTETTINATSWHCGLDDLTAPIGPPVRDTTAYVLDRHLEPVPVGAIGELWIGGVQVARGYAQRPGLTGERFIPDPFAARSGVRMYRTGDLVRQRRDDALEYVGRADSQVKVRGYRIELGEIETTLASHDGVREAAVVLRDTGSDKVLVAYVCLRHATELQHVRAYAVARLPAYMVPSAFVTLVALPRSAGGKLDRRALPSPAADAYAHEDYVAPSTPTELALAERWCQLLRVARAGLDDNFFALGGNSLLAVRLVSRIREQLGVDLPLRTVFEAPTLGGLAARIVGARNTETLAPSVIKTEPGARTRPLSFAQQQLWLIEQITPGSPQYNMPLVIWLAGQIDERALERALRAIDLRHDVLRSRIAIRDSAPVAFIDDAPFALEVLDLRGVPDPDVAARAEIDQEALRPFDLARERPWRARLLRTGHATSVLLVTLHHIVGDGWSLEILGDELGRAYNAGRAGGGESIVALPIQYGDYAAWQRAWLTEAVAESQLAFWQRQLADVPAVLALPCDRPRPPVMSHAGGEHVQSLAATVEQLETLGRANGATLFMTLLAAFQTLLSRYAGAREFVVGTPSSGRNRPELESVIGFFVNTLALHADVSGNPTFRELLARVRETALAAYAHQDVPFERVVHALNPERSLALTPVFQVLFQLETPTLAGLTLGGVAARYERSTSHVAKFDLQLEIEQVDDQLVAHFVYARDLFDAATIARMAASFERIVQQVATDAERHIDDLDVVSAHDLALLLGDWNAPHGMAPPERCLHDLVAEQATRTPDAIAVAHAGRELSYRELMQRARRLAHRLRVLGVGPNTLVAVCAQRCPDLIVGLLGVLEAGGAYVPLDPASPSGRLRHILEDTRARIVLVTAGTADLASSLDLQVIRLDDPDPDEAAKWLNTRVTTAVTPRDLCYVIYTSGSTGRPKGVAIQHASPAAYVQWARGYFASETFTGSLGSTAITFDVSVFELFTTLASGGTIQLVEHALALSDHPAASTVTWINTVPSAIAELLELDAVPRSLRTVNLAGEAVPQKLVDRLLAVPTIDRVVNLYGPTETGYTTFADLSANERVHIGRPLPGVEIYILDAALRPVPIGVVGELYAAGVGVARGYFGLSAQTAQRFVPNPYGPDASARMYRTGDLAKYLTNGNIEYVGRADEQVKLRGFRVELGEIEAALLAHPLVREAAVVVREHPATDKRLVAYVVGTKLTADELRSFVGETLPSYMLPSAVVWLEAMPRLANGKLDRRALPAPDSVATAGAHRAPRTFVEEMLAGIWSQLLAIGRIGVDDHFFHLGGHSLLATRLCSRIREVFGVELPLRSVFEAPTLADLAQKIAALRDTSDAIARAIEPQLRSGELPLSFAQQRLWLIDQLAPGSALYNLPMVFRITGALDVAALEHALQQVHLRHETLRSSFVNRGGRPAVVLADRPFTVNHVDLRAADDPALAVRERVASEIVRPFDLATQLPWRALLLRSAPDQHALVVTMHHIVSDGWSLDLFADDLGRSYAAHHHGQPSSLGALHLQYADYAIWQRTHVTDAVLDGQLAYWKRQLAGAPPLLELPLDRPRPSVPSNRGGTHVFALTPTLSRRLEALSREYGVTLYMTLLAAFQLLLHRSSRQDDILVGTPIAGRTRREVEGLIGFFVNTLVMRSDFSRNPTFAESLAQVRETALAAYAHQDLPFEKLVDELNPERSLSYTPVFQAMFQLDRRYAANLELPGVTTVLEATDSGLTKFDLSMAVEHGDDRLVVALEFARDLFDDSTIARTADRFERLLEAVVAQPKRRVADVELLSGVDRELLASWNATSRVYPRDRCVHELVSAQTQRTPDAVAVVCEGQQLTYRELDSRSNQLARHLQQLGVVPEVLVGICVERSLEMVVGILAILKAGGAYVPLDPGYPKDRLAFMISDARVAVLLTQAQLTSALPAHGARVVVLDELATELATISNAPVTSGVSAEHLAYVEYTSGSTGQPKGVSVPHRAVVRLVASPDYLDITPDDVFLQLSPLAFDASTLELWAPLVHGGRLVMLAPGAPSLESLGKTLVAHGVTTLWLTAGLFHQMVDHQLASLAGLRCLLAGGDVLSPSHVRTVVETLSCRMINGYGPTENTTFSCCHEVRGLPTAGTSIAIGKPIANTRVYVLDGECRPVPVGVPGELYLAGDGLARGYLHRPALTAATFVPDPFGDGRLYRTGDLARWLPDGTIEFLGRIDQQVKVRGYRIELGEIEAGLVRHGDVKDAVVLAREDQPGNKRLVAYLVAASAVRPTVAALRDFLVKTLPEYMVPSVFVWLEALPLTLNGKIDRRALPVPDASRDDTAYRAPQTPEEDLLAGIWAQLLAVGRIGSDDHFFHLGGHSLLATRLVSRVRALFGVELPLRSVFEAPTLAGFAQRIIAARSTGQASSTPIVPQPRDGDLPLSYTQQRLWLIEQVLPESAVYMPLVFRLVGALDVPALERALQDIHHRHEALRSTFVNRAGRPAVVISDAAFELTNVDLASAVDPDRAARDHVEREIARRFDLANDLPWRAMLIRSGPDSYVLAVTMHHIVSDGWSLDVLARELGQSYRAHHEGRPSPLGALAIQYSDYAIWQRTHLTADALESQLAYWKRQLAGAPPVLELPLDRPRTGARSPRGGEHAVMLGSKLSQQLEALSRQHGVTLYMTMLAAFQTLLHRISRQDDILVGTPIAGRTRHELEGLIGYFVNTLVMRSDFSTNPTFVELLATVRETALSAYAHQDLPFSQVVDGINPERNLSHTPLFQVFFQLEPHYIATLDLPPVTTSPELTDTRAAMYDLHMMIVRGDDLRVEIQFTRDLFDDATIVRMADHFVQLLHGIVARPERRVDELPLVSASERTRLLAESSHATTAGDDFAPLHALFEHQVERTPDQPAVRWQERELSYRELDRAANQIARRLRAAGVGRGDIVGVCGERSPEMICALVAVLKSGAAYLPLDPRLPPGRREWMRLDARARAVITWRGAQLEAPAEIAIIDLDDGAHTAESSQKLECVVSADDLAYVIYTSGSTGKPKGVAVAHAAISVFVKTAIADYELSSTDRVLQFASFAWDTSCEEIFPTLACGGTLVLREPTMTDSVVAFMRICQRERVTVLDLPTAFWHELALSIDTLSQLPATVRLVIIGGEDAALERLHQWWSAIGDRVRLVNTYGVTEATVVSTICDLVPRLANNTIGGQVPLGGPIRGAETLVLDGHLEPAPVGIPGELWIGGTGLARGYVHRPALTSERFIPHPFAADRRLYRTGDLARRRPDGALEYLGRSDQQVKVRGLRIELGEIDAALGRHSAVKEAIVLAREDQPGNKRLVAYLVAASAARPTVLALREFVGKTLPEYMVPSAFVWLDALPLMLNGKIDRRALPMPDVSGDEAGYRPPQTPEEDLLAGIWSQLLQVGRIGRDDHFFHLGGHSLLATRLASRVRELFGVELPLRSVFEAPTLAGFAQRIIGARSTGHSSTPIVPQPREGELPLSYTQQRLWLIEQVLPESAVYMPLAFRLVGALDVPALERALQDIHQRHEVLRSTFVNRAGHPVLVISEVEFELTTVDVTGADDPDGATRACVTNELARPFDLANDLPWRAMLVRSGPDSYVLAMTMHHIVSDGWSLDVLARELSQSYRAHHEGRPSPLGALAIQYSDYAIWQRTYLTADALESQLAYWKRQLVGAPPILELPLDRPRTATRSPRGGEHTVMLGPKLSRQLEALSRQHGVTLYMTMLAAFQTLLHRISRQDDILVGTPIAGRTRHEVEGLIGFFVNTLVMRSDFSTNPTFVELVSTVRETALSAYAHQDLPFGQVVDEINPERNLSHTPLFQVFFQLEQRYMATFDLPLVRSTHAADLTATRVAMYDLHMTIVRGEQLTVDFQFTRDLFDDSTIVRMAEHFVQLLEGIVARPERRVDELPLVSASERARLLAESSRAAAAADDFAPLHALIEHQVERVPDQPAVRWNERELSYRELDRHANHIAHRLRAAGVGRGDIVGVCGERSPEMICALVAVLKSGAAYLPLDPELPQGRREWMLRDARARALLTWRMARLEAPTGIAIIDLDDSAPTAQSSQKLACVVSADDLAYVIYTSGSTGKPKGVGVAHAAISAFVKTAIVDYELSSTDRVLQFASFAWDTSCEEIFPTLACGGTLVLREPAMTDSVVAFMRACQRERVTVLDLPTAFWHELALTANTLAQLPASVRLVIIGGEHAALERLHQWSSTIGDRVRLVNTYGVTEATIVSTMCDLVPRLTNNTIGSQVPLGGPIRGAETLVLDSHLEPVPEGIPGELWIGGSGLARGYVHRPALTAERFIPHPFAADRRLYRTGDLARRRPDGALEYLGRSDQQVKVRGLRIELGEIESTLLQHADVRVAVVVARSDRSDTKVLVAYLCLEGAADVDDVRRFVVGRLPTFMVPSAFVVLDQMPVTTVGKIDRKALLALPPPVLSRDEALYVAPRSPTETALQSIWSRVLHVERVGRDDNFFALGGHSFLVMRLVAGISHELSQELPPRTVFENPTIAGLAERIDALTDADASTRDPAESELVALITTWSDAEVATRLAEWSRPNREVMPALSSTSLTGDRRALLDRLLAQHHVDARSSLPIARRASTSAPITVGQLEISDFQVRGNFPSLCNLANAFVIRGGLDVSAMEHAVAALVRRQRALRSVFDLDIGHGVQTVREHGAELEIVDLSNRPATERWSSARELFTEIGSPHDVAREVLRAQLLRLDDHEHVLLIAPNHLAVDGFSWGILLSDLAAIYVARAAGVQPTLRPLEFEFSDFCLWQTSLEQRPIGIKQLAFWADAVAGYERLELPFDLQPGPRGDAIGLATDTYRSGGVPFSIDGDDWDALERMCARLACTPYTVTAAACLLFLTRLSGRHDACLLSANFHRNRRGSEDVIGNFNTAYPLRMFCDEDATLGATVQRCHERILAHREHCHVGPRSALAAWPHWIQFSLNYQIGEMGAVFGSLDVDALPWILDAPRTPHDLALFVNQGPHRLRGELIFNAERFSPERATKAATRLRQIVHEIVTSPSERVSTLRRTL